MPQSSAAITSDAVATPGSTAIPSFAAALDDGPAEARRDDEARTGVARPVDLLGAHDGPGADEQFGIGRERTQRFDRAGRAKRHLHDGQAAELQGRA